MVENAIHFLGQMEFLGFVTMFWHWFLFDLPRYVLDIVPVLTVATYTRFRRDKLAASGPIYSGGVSIILAGHNEEHALRRCVLGLKEQTHKTIQIVVVSDGSTDGMAELARDLARQGLIDTALSSPLRGGKSSAVNLALPYCRHPVIVNMDIDTTLDRDAIAILIEAFGDAEVGAVAGNLGVRNAEASLVARFQAIEYLDSISIGRRFTSLANILQIVSGGYGAFRREAIDSIGGWEVGPGEDADITDKIRRAGWSVRFAHRSWALTDVPETLRAFIKQRLRWDRSVIRIRFRKFGLNLNPFSGNFSIRNALATINIMVFQVLLTLSFSVYIVWLFWVYSEFAPIIIAMVAIFYIIEDFLIFSVVCLLYPERRPARHGLYLIGSSLFRAYLIRFVRLAAILDELMVRRSYRDSYVPTKVLDQASRF